jgi:hypothetical protein
MFSGERRDRRDNPYIPVRLTYRWHGNVISSHSVFSYSVDRQNTRSPFFNQRPERSVDWDLQSGYVRGSSARSSGGVESRRAPERALDRYIYVPGLFWMSICTLRSVQPILRYAKITPPIYYVIITKNTSIIFLAYYLVFVLVSCGHCKIWT